MWIGNAPSGIRFERDWNRKGRTAAYVPSVRKRQGGLFLTAAACCTLPSQQHWDWEPVKLIEWHRESGTIERVHDVLKNEATGVLPSKSSGNAAWLRLAVISTTC